MTEIPTPNDQHQEPRGMFWKSEIDRDISSYSEVLKDSEGNPLIRVAGVLFLEGGKLRFLDAGCGTGRAIFTLREELAMTTGLPRETIEVTGINDVDYRAESRVIEVRRAALSGSLKYLVADLDDVDLQPASYDLITSLEVLIHNDNEKAFRIINKLLSALAPGGKMFFTLREPQRTVMSPNLDSLSSNGFSIFERRVFDQWAGNNSRIVTMIEKSRDRQKQ